MDEPSVTVEAKSAHIKQDNDDIYILLDMHNEHVIRVNVGVLYTDKELRHE